MQLTLYTDYSLRVLVYLGMKNQQLATISEIADFYQISRNHLVKVVNQLVNDGFIQSTRGKKGGLRLARAPELISVGEVVRKTEPNFNLVECFGSSTDGCAITPICTLKNALYRGMNDFLATLDRFTLADAISPGAREEAKSFPIQVVVENRKKKYTPN